MLLRSMPLSGQAFSVDATLQLKRLDVRRLAVYHECGCNRMYDPLLTPQQTADWLKSMVPSQEGERYTVFPRSRARLPTQTSHTRLKASRQAPHLSLIAMWSNLYRARCCPPPFPSTYPTVHPSPPLNPYVHPHNWSSRPRPRSPLILHGSFMWIDVVAWTGARGKATGLHCAAAQSATAHFRCFVDRGGHLYFRAAGAPFIPFHPLLAWPSP